jgi:hypothetical protein
VLSFVDDHGAKPAGGIDGDDPGGYDRQPGRFPEFEQFAQALVAQPDLFDGDQLSFKSAVFLLQAEILLFGVDQPEIPAPETVNLLQKVVVALQ